MSNLRDLINDDDYCPPRLAAERDDDYSPPRLAAADRDDTESESSADPPHLASFDRIKTHFPAARIKKIMQSDEEIGKVAQATPVIVGRALEIFMANLIDAAMAEARHHGARRIAASHIRAAVENTEQFDFLVDAVSKYPASSKQT